MKELNIKLKVEKEAFKKKIGVVDGKDGIDGKTPVKGKDYLTDKEMEKIKGELVPIPGIDFDLPEDGKDADEGRIISEVVKLIPVPKDGEDGSPDTPEQVKEKLETLKGKERLDAKAIKNLPEFVKTVSAQDAPDLSNYLKLDQTTPQSIINGAPIFEAIDFDITATQGDKVGRLKWNETDRCLEFTSHINGSMVNNQVGQEMWVRVRNNTGVEIENGKPVYITGSVGNRPTIALAKADSEATSLTFIGLTTEAIPNNDDGFVTLLGSVRSVNTNAYVAGDLLYLSADTAGEFTTTRPEAPNQAVFIGMVTVKSGTGEIIVQPRIQPNIDRLSNVQIDSVADGDFLQYNSSTLRWENKNANEVGLVTQEEWKQNGFDDNYDSTITFTDATRTFSIQPTATSYDYWVSGVKYTSTGDTVIIGGGTTADEGIWIIYYDDATLTAVQNPSMSAVSQLIRFKALVSILYWNATDEESIYVGEERHGKVMSPDTHDYLHFVNGLEYLSGLGLTNILSDDDGDVDASAQFGVDAGSVTDEDLYLAISTVTSTTGLPIYYMLGATARWDRHLEAGFSVRTFDGTDTTRLAWNEYTGGAWKLTEITNRDFVLYHIFATTEKDKPMIAIMGQNDYTTKRKAREGALVEVKSLITNDVLFPEIRPVATIIFESQDAFDNQVKSRIVTTDEGDDYIDWRSETISRTSISTSAHGDSTGLLNDDHPQYSLVDGTRAYTGAVIAPDFIRNATRTYTYNANGLVETMTVAGGLTTTYSYDANDLITSFTDTIRTWTPTYDGDDNITEITVT